MTRTSRRFSNVGGEPVPDAGTAFELRKRYARFGGEDARLLAELAPAVAAEADTIVDLFYEHLQRFEPVAALVAEPGTVARLKRAQKRYLLTLFSGSYDDTYAAGRLAIGRVHEKIGLDPQWYLGTYGLYFDLLMPIVERHFGHERSGEACRAAAALSKLLTIDMQIVLDAYYQTRHRKELRKSEQLAAVGELAASIAHEVRNPLAGMKGALEVLRGEFEQKPQHLEIVDELLLQIERLEHLVRDLLTYARPRAVNRQAFDLHDLLDRLLRSYQDSAAESGVDLRREYGAGTRILNADLHQMEQVFLNLIYNALQAMERGGTLVVSTRVDGVDVVVAFADTGPGIPPADLTRVFQPFFTTKHRGSGLGLPIVKKILEAHGGSVEVSSELGAGTTAAVSIPIVEGE